MVAFGGIRAGRAYVEIGTDQRQLDKGLAGIGRKLKAMGDSAMAAGAQLLRMATIAAAPLALSTKVFAGFEDQLLAVKAVTGATGQQFTMLYEKAKLLGRTTSYTASQVGEAMLNLSRAGFRPAETDDAIASMLDLARATGTDLAESADIAAATLRAFDYEAKDLTYVADTLTATANNSAQTLTDLGQAMKYAAPFAAEAKWSFVETAKALAVMANMGIRGTMAGTALRGAIMRLSTERFRREIENLGVAVVDLDKNLLPIDQILSNLGKKLATMGTGERIGLITKIFGARPAGGVSKVMFSADRFEDMAQRIEFAGGVAKRTAKIMDSGLGGSFRMLWSAIEGVAISIGETLAPMLQSFSGWAQKVAAQVQAWVERNKRLVATFVGVVVGTAAAGAALFAAGLALKALGVIAGVFVTAGSVVVGTFRAIAWSARLMVNPINLAARWLETFVAYFAKYVPGMETALHGVGEGFKALGAKLARMWAGVADAVSQGDFSAAWEIVTLELEMSWLALTDRIAAIWNTWGVAIVDVATDVVAKVVTAWEDLRVVWGETVAGAMATSGEALETWWSGAWMLADRAVKRVEELAAVMDRLEKKWGVLSKAWQVLTLPQTIAGWGARKVTEGSLNPKNAERRNALLMWGLGKVSPASWAWQQLTGDEPSTFVKLAAQNTPDTGLQNKIAGLEGEIKIATEEWAAGLDDIGAGWDKWREKAIQAEEDYQKRIAEIRAKAAAEAGEANALKAAGRQAQIDAAKAARDARLAEIEQRLGEIQQKLQLPAAAVDEGGQALVDNLSVAGDLLGQQLTESFDTGQLGGLLVTEMGKIGEKITPPVVDIDPWGMRGPMADAIDLQSEGEAARKAIEAARRKAAKVSEAAPAIDDLLEKRSRMTRGTFYASAMQGLQSGGYLRTLVELQRDANAELESIDGKIQDAVDQQFM